MTRMLAAAAALLAVFVLFVVFAGHVAFAQDVIAVTPTSPAPVPSTTVDEMTWIALKSVFVAVLTVVGGAVPWLAPALKEFWARGAEMKTAVGGVEWERYEKDAMGMAAKYAQKMVGISAEKLDSIKQKNKYVGWMLEYLELHHEDIVRMVDKNENGVIDIIETHLVGIAPDKVFPGIHADEEEVKPAKRKVSAVPAGIDPTIAKFAPKGNA